MRRSVLIAFGLAAAMAGTAAAQAPRGDTLRQPRADGARPERFDRRGGGPDGFLLRGITLSETQKTQLDQLRTSERQRMEATRTAGKARVEQVREARQRGDTAAMRAEGQKRREEMQRMREQHVAAVRAILTPEQRVQLDKNVAELKQREAQKGSRLGKGGRPGGRGQGKPGRR
jgi:Spy/CpxP family protein refolding chaperone